jgi:hypothetical protein
MNISEKKRMKERQNRTEWNELSAGRSNTAVYYVMLHYEEERGTGENRIEWEASASVHCG